MLNNVVYFHQNRNIVSKKEVALNQLNERIEMIVEPDQC